MTLNTKGVTEFVSDEASRLRADGGLPLPGPRRSTLRMAVLLATMFVAALSLPAVSAAGKMVDSFIGNPTATTGTTGGLFNTPRGVAVNDATGAVYVVDGSNNRVQQFDAANNFVRAWGQDVVGVNEQQRVVVSATGGTYTLTFNGSTTTNIAFNASSATVDNALDVLASIGGDANVAVSGSLAAGYTVTFQGTLAGTDVPEMTANSGSLTGGASTVTISTLVTGAGGPGTGFEVCSTAAICKAGITGTTGGALNSPQGVSVNQTTGDVYVTDGSNLRVQQFTASGGFVRAWGQDVIVAAGPPPNANGIGFEVCDTTAGNTAAECKQGVSGATGGAFASTFSGYPAIVPAGAPNAGNVLIADPGNSRVQEFTANGAFVRAFGFDVVQPGGSGEAFGPLQNELQKVVLPLAFGCCSVDGGTFTLTFNGATTSALDAMASAADVRAALEALSSIGAGNVSVVRSGSDWMVEFTGALAVTNVSTITGDGSGLTFFGSPAGLGAFAAETTVQGGTLGPAQEVCTIASQCKAGVVGSRLGQFGSNEPKRVAVDGSGGVYTLETSSGSRVQRFASSTLEPASFAAGVLGVGPGPIELAVDSVAGRVYVSKGISNSQQTGEPVIDALQCPGTAEDAGANEQRILEFTTGGVLENTHMVCARIASVTGLGLRPSNGRVYLASTTTGHRTYVLDADGATPAIATVIATSNIEARSVKISGVVNSNGQLATSYRFEVSRNGSTWTSEATGSVPAGTSDVPIVGEVTDLLPNTVYRVRIVTNKGLGNADVSSGEATFLTDAIPPEISGLTTAGIDNTTATLRAFVNPHSTATRYQFEYGVGSFSHRMPIPASFIGSSSTFVGVSEDITGLKPATTYQYRLIVTSETEGVVTSEVRTLTTRLEAKPRDERTYELVSPAYKASGIGVGYT